MDINMNTFRLFIFSLFLPLYGGYITIHGQPKTLQEAIYILLAASFMVAMIIIVFIITSLIFGLPIHKFLKQINKK